MLSQAVDLIRMNNTRRCSERRYDPWNDVVKAKTREIVRVSTDAKRSGHASSLWLLQFQRQGWLACRSSLCSGKELTVRSIAYAASAIIDRLAAPDVPRGSASIEPRSSITGSTA